MRLGLGDEEHLIGPCLTDRFEPGRRWVCAAGDDINQSGLQAPRQPDRRDELLVVRWLDPDDEQTNYSIRGTSHGVETEARMFPSFSVAFLVLHPRYHDDGYKEI